MNYLLHICGRYYFSRRVPAYLRAYDPRREIRTSLFTDSRKEAMRLALFQNEQLESYWRNLVAEGKTHCPDAFKAITRQNRLASFTADASLHTINAKAEAPVATEERKNPLTIEEGLTLFWGFAKNKTLNKSPNQLRKWRGPRKTAINNLIKCIGNKAILDVNRADILKFRDWWIERIQDESLGANAANKNFIQVKVIFETVSENLSLNIDIKTLFRKLLLEEKFETSRLSFESDYIRNILLNPAKLTGLTEQARWILHAIAETGAGIAEQVNLMSNDIHLNCEIPYIEITPRHKNALKTRYRKRIIPLVGYALDAFKACPNGFSQYQDRPDSLSSHLNKYLRENNLLPTENHSVYSLRHSFQDRLLAANAPDRVQADLMGHKFNRPSYGQGATLAHKLEWMQKIQLKGG